MLKVISQDVCLSGGHIAATAWCWHSGSHSQYSFSKSAQQNSSRTFDIWPYDIWYM